MRCIIRVANNKDEEDKVKLIKELDEYEKETNDGVITVDEIEEDGIHERQR